METGTKSPVGGSTRKTLITLAKTAVGGAVLYAVFKMVDIREVMRSLQSASIPYVLAASLLLAPNLATRALKWKLMLRNTVANITAWDAFVSMLLGLSLGSFTPGQIGELGGRYLTMTHGKSAHIIGLTVLDRTQVFLVLAMAGLSSFAVIYLPALQAIVISIGSLALCTVVYFHLELVQNLARRMNLKIFKKEWFQDFLESFGFLDRGALVKTLLYSIVYDFVLVAQMYCALNAFGHVDLWRTFLGFSPMMFLKALLPISIADLGIREGGSVYFFSLLGVPQVVALNASLLMFAINIVLPSFLGVAFLPSVRTQGKPAAAELSSRSEPP